MRKGAGAGVARNRFAVARSPSFASFVKRFDEKSSASSQVLKVARPLRS